MSNRIKKLDRLLASKIAAGEVVERPASVVKELMENSIDAGAASVTVYLADGGRRMVRVVDDGEGITREDVPLAFGRNATSKISSEADLESILTLGFRGEALYSIASVSRVVLKTRTRSDIAGTSAVVEGGAEPALSDEGCPEGTSVEVSDIFFNTPARLKFLRSKESEYGRAAEVFKSIALVNPDKRFRLFKESNKVIDSPAGSLKGRIADLYGDNIAGKLVEVSTPYVKGFVSDPEITYSTSKSMHVYINGRAVRDRSINRAVIDGYGSILASSRYPFAVINVLIPHEDVDVNIHPAKTEVRFKNQRGVFDAVKSSVRAALATGLTPGRASTEAAAQDNPGTGWRNTYAFETQERYEAQERPFGTQRWSGGATQRFEFTGAAGEVKNPEFLTLEFVGQLWGEFLVAESPANGGEFFLIDQHGAAERCAFEKLKSRYFSGERPASQILLLPERFEATPEETEAINTAMPYLEKFGFEVVPFGPAARTAGETFIVKMVPEILSSRNSAGLVKDIAGELGGGGSTTRVEDNIESVLMRIACHSVIRGPRPLSAREGAALLRELADVDFAGHCPHGRPVVKKYTRGEIEAVFKR